MPGYQFHPLFKQKIWDGNIRLYSNKTNLLYAGLRHYVERFCEEREYEHEYSFDTSRREFSVVEAKEFIAKLKLPDHIEVRDYQIKAFVECVRDGRMLILSPTASGKSLIIYILMRFYAEKSLFVVPTIGLVHQLYSDFESYGFKSDKYCFKIYQGTGTETKKQILISTWQSIYKLPKTFYDNIKLIVVDEAHLATAKSLKDIMEKATDCYNRFGFTGTLDGTQTHKLVLEGLFGRVFKTASTTELIDAGHLSEFKIKALLLKHPEISCKLLKGSTYSDEIDYLVSSAARNTFIKNLALSLEGNTLILFRLVEKHGKLLYDEIKAAVGETRSVYYIHGGVDGQERDDMRKIIETENNAIIVASYGTFSTGINIVALRNLIFASPYKGRIKVLQSIGRVLRKGEGHDQAVLFDIADDLSYKKHNNHTLKHFMERIKIYHQEKFNPKIYKINLKES